MKNWENLCGENNWEGLLEPLDDNLRRLIIHYGEMVETTYTAYDSNENSTTGCKYDKENLFSEVGLGKGFAKKKYNIAKFIYATTYKRTKWMGYIAVATDERKKELGRRDIVVAWRGTKDLPEASKTILVLKKPASKIIDSKIEVHMGFYKIYTKKSTICNTSARDQVLKEVKILVEKHKNENVRVIVSTGHSLGGALAILNAIDIAINVPSQPNVTAFPFGCPQVGGSDLSDLVANNIPNFHILRTAENKPDIIPGLLRLDQIDYINDFFEDHQYLQWIKKLIDKISNLITISYYVDVGQVLKVDTDKSDYLRRVKLTIKAKLRRDHEMEVYLHGVSGKEGYANASFKKNVERDIALVNKYGDYLKDSYGFPTSWWNKPNKANMVQIEDGSWKLPVTRKRDWMKRKFHSVFYKMSGSTYFINN